MPTRPRPQGSMSGVGLDGRERAAVVPMRNWYFRLDIEGIRRGPHLQSTEPSIIRSDSSFLLSAGSEPGAAMRTRANANRDERLHHARRFAVRNRLVVELGMELEQAEGWCEAWEAEATRQGLVRGREYYWDAGRGWIDAHFDARKTAAESGDSRRRTATVTIHRLDRNGMVRVG